MAPCWVRCLQVVVGVGDPNPLVAAEGIATLEKAGIQVRRPRYRQWQRWGEEVPLAVRLATRRCMVIL